MVNYFKNDLGAIALFALRNIANEGMYQNIGVVANHALNYSMGRRTYAPSLVIDWIKRNWELLNNGDKNNIRRDTFEFIRSPRLKGDACDYETWQNFYNWLIAQELKVYLPRYQNKEISLSKLAESIYLSIEETIDVLNKMGILVELPSATIEQLQLEEDINNA